MPQVRRGGGVPPEAGLGGAGGMRPHIAGGWAAYAEEKAAPCVFARPQQKSGPTEVNENNGVDPLPSEVCAEPVRESIRASLLSPHISCGHDAVARARKTDRGLFDPEIRPFISM